MTRVPKSVTGLVLVVSLSFFLAASAADLYVSPSGKPDGDGSKDKPLDVFTALSAKGPAKPGDTIYLVGGQYDGKMDGIKRVAFELAVSGTKEAPVRVMPAPGQAAHLNGTALVGGAYAHYIGLEIGDLEWDPWAQVHKADTALNSVQSNEVKIINCNVFGGGMGTGAWVPAKGLEIYGTLIHDFGGLDPAGGRGHGHCYYAQNKDGTKVFEHNVAYRGCGWNVHIYTQGADIEGFDVIENICYLAGGYRPGQNMDNFIVTGYKPADRIRLIGNIAYQPRDIEKWRGNCRLITIYKPLQNGTAEVRDNWIMGAFYGLSMGDWKKMTVTGNTIWSTGVLMEISSAPTGSAIPPQETKPDLANYSVDGNTFYGNGGAKPFLYGQSETVQDGKGLLTFAEWQALGLDKNSRLLPDRNGKPTGTKVTVFPNKYQPGRANVGIFNWDGRDAVEVDLRAVLKEKQKYRVYNCLDIRTTITRAVPALAGEYDGKPVAFPMRKDVISPDFDAFLVVGQ